MRFPQTRFFWLALCSALGAWYWRNVYRFRDPVRVSPADQLVAPCDGVVSFVRRVTDGSIKGAVLGQLSLSELFSEKTPLHQEGWLIGVFVGPLDVHYMYQPCEGTLNYLEFVPSRRGKNKTLLTLTDLPMLWGQPSNLLTSRATSYNERYIYTIGGLKHKATAKQPTKPTAQQQTDQMPASISIACVAPRSGVQAMTYIALDEDVRKGHKALFLEEGGLILIHLPQQFVPQVSVGERLVGAQTPLAILDPADAVGSVEA